tara:strand:- start:1564 stop:2934 length:1371 start_codon:yes stop_codon:yes gene_type:complete
MVIFMLLKKSKIKLYKFYYFLLIFFFRLTFNLKSDFLSSLIILISIKRIKKVSQNSKNSKNILIFSKVGGIDDVITAYQKKKNNKINFFIIHRIFFRIIYNRYFSKTNLRDYSYKINTKKLEDLSKKYSRKIDYYLSFINKFYNFKSIISFNPFYKAERIIQKNSKKHNIKFIVLHKESVNSKYDNKVLEYLYSNKIEKFEGEAIATYSNLEKKLLINSGFIDKKKIVTVGSPRCDLSYQYRKISPDKDVITYYMLETQRGVPGYFLGGLSKVEKRILCERLKLNVNDLKINWNDLNKKTIGYCIDYAKKNKDIKIIFKGKQSTHTRSDLPSNLPENCTFIKDGSGHELLKKSKIIIGFNSTIILEAMLANRSILVPYFNFKEINKKKDFIIDFNNKNYWVKTRSDFFQKIDKLIKNKYKYKKLSKPEKKILVQFIGNSDGKACKRLIKFINSSIR